MAVGIAELEELLERVGEGGDIGFDVGAVQSAYAEALSNISQPPAEVVTGNEVVLLLKRNQVGDKSLNTQEPGSCGELTVEGMPQYKWDVIEDSDRGCATFADTGRMKQQFLTKISIPYGTWQIKNVASGRVQTALNHGNESATWYGLAKAAGSAICPEVQLNGLFQGVRLHPGINPGGSEGCLLINPPGSVNRKNAKRGIPFPSGKPFRDMGSPQFEAYVQGTMMLYSFLMPQLKAGKKVLIKIT